MSPIKRMTSAFSSAGDRSSRLPGGDMPLQNLKSLYVESPDLSIFTRAVAPCPPTAADSKTSAARTFAPITEIFLNPLFGIDESDKGRGRTRKIPWSREFLSGAAPAAERLPRSFSGFLYRQILERRGVGEAGDAAEGAFPDSRSDP